MALFFAGDHFTWAYSVGLISDKAVNDRWAKISTYSWLLGSVATVVTESYGVAALAVVRKEGESEEDFNKRLDAARTAINQKLLVVVHATVQSVLAAGEFCLCCGGACLDRNLPMVLLHLVFAYSWDASRLFTYH